jgi:soluble lytic murein transglycosylase-like protein
MASRKRPSTRREILKTAVPSAIAVALGWGIAKRGIPHYRSRMKQLELDLIAMDARSRKAKQEFDKSSEGIARTARRMEVEWREEKILPTWRALKKMNYSDARKFLRKFLKLLYRNRIKLSRGERIANMKKFSPLIEKMAKRVGVDPTMMKKLVGHESGWNPFAVSRDGDFGLCQMNFQTFDSRVNSEYHHNPLNPEQTLYHSCRFMKHLLGLFKGDVGLALTAYNEGEGRILQRVRSGISKERILAMNPNNYARKVLAQKV